MSDPNTVAIAYRLFEAALGRVPDAASLGYHVALLDAGLGAEGLAQVFAANPEFVQRYGALSNTAFVTQLYENVLHREPDAAGLAFQVGRLDAGTSRADMLLGFSESPENVAAMSAATSDGIAFLPTLLGTPLADHFTVTTEHIAYEGGAGVDIASFPGAHDSYDISAGSQTIVRALDGGVFILHDVERLHFTDATVAVDTDFAGHTGEAYRLYQAAFGRKPDLPGLEFQVHAMDEGASWVQVAANFLASPEFTAKYGNVASLDDMQFLTVLHHNMTADPDPLAIQVQLAQLHGGASRADILTEVTETYAAPFLGDVALAHGIVIGS